MIVLVTGANGQLGQSLRFIAPNYPEIDFVFCSSSDLDISDSESCKSVFSKIKPHYCVNAAAYTAVDKAESEQDKAYLTNVIGVRNLAEACQKYDTILIHISTDFVFDGSGNIPYREGNTPNPTGVYGQTKLDGEKAVQSILEHYYIIRTSWVYSKFANNFMKTMLRLASERDSISVVNDQIGSPTNAVDLAAVLLTIILSGKQEFGIYNFSNEGQCSWYGFAQKIFEFNNVSIDLKPIPTSSYPTPANRPKYSVLDNNKIKETFDLKIKTWEESLKSLSI